MNYYLTRFKANAATDWYEKIDRAESIEALTDRYRKTFPFVEFEYIKHLPYPEGYDVPKD
jgi:hypothetical protein